MVSSRKIRASMGLISSASRGRNSIRSSTSYWFILRFVRGWRSILVSVFALTLILSLLIPHPWPRPSLAWAARISSRSRATGADGRNSSRISPRVRALRSRAGGPIT